MITKKLIRRLDVPRDFAIEHINELKSKNPNLRVVDVGGGICSWSDHVTDIVDIFIVPGSKEILEKQRPNVNIHAMDINNPNNWDHILEDVEKNGKFDFSICTHTLEDIPYPNLVCDMLMKISKAGIIAVPSKYAEYLRFERQYGISGYRGFFHHKWIYSLKNDVFTGYEKNNYWEYVNGYKINKPDGLFTEICFMWEESFEYKFYHIGQTVGADNHPAMYKELLQDDDLVI